VTLLVSTSYVPAGDTTVVVATSGLFASHNQTLLGLRLRNFFE
jgi:hypothetical protein